MATTLTGSVQGTARPSRPAQQTGVRFEAFDLPTSNQKVLDAPHQSGTVSPLALRPAQHNQSDLDLDSVVDTVKALQTQDGILTKQLASHGTLLFRGLPINGAHDFSKFALQTARDYWYRGR